MRPDFLSPETVESVREVVRQGPHWLIYAALLALSGLGAAIGIKAVSPGERLATVEAVNARQDSVDIRLAEQISREDIKTDAILALLCVKTTDIEHRIARVSCPTGMAK